MLIWAARDIQRHWGRATLLFACLTSLVFLTATTLLFSQALAFTWARLLDQAPDLVIRRIDAGGWAPMPADEAVACAGKVAGVIDPTPRLWGVAAGPDGPVTVVASTAALPAGALKGVEPPAAGQAVVGRGATGAAADSRLTLLGHRRLVVEIVATFPADTGLATHDLVWLTAEDSRRLLGLAPDQASDLAVHLFRREEAQAIQADLAAAFPWPVRIIDRSTSAQGHHLRAMRTGGLTAVAGIPALLALLLIIVGTVADSSGRRTGWGLLKALGWTTADIVKLQIFKATVVGMPAVLLGLATAYAVVFYPPAAGVTAFWITGGQYLPALALNPTGASITMLEIVALVALPYLATVFLTSLRGAAEDPWRLLQTQPWN